MTRVLPAVMLAVLLVFGFGCGPKEGPPPSRRSATECARNPDYCLTRKICDYDRTLDCIACRCETDPLESKDGLSPVSPIEPMPR